MFSPTNCGVAATILRYRWISRFGLFEQSERVISQIRRDLSDVEFGSDQESQIIGCALADVGGVDSDTSLPEVSAEANDERRARHLQDAF